MCHETCKNIDCMYHHDTCTSIIIIIIISFSLFHRCQLSWLMVLQGHLKLQSHHSSHLRQRIDHLCSSISKAHMFGFLIVSSNHHGFLLLCNPTSLDRRYGQMINLRWRHFESGSGELKPGFNSTHCQPYFSLWTKPKWARWL